MLTGTIVSLNENDGTENEPRLWMRDHQILDVEDVVLNTGEVYNVKSCKLGSWGKVPAQIQFRKDLTNL